MFVEHKEALEVTEAPAKTLKLSEAIRRGHTMIEEDRHRYLRSNKGCALGAMWVGMGRTEEEFRQLINQAAFPSYEVADVLGFDQELAITISAKHHRGMPRLEIADWLEAQGL
jgi:hypothetical protein